MVRNDLILYKGRILLIQGSVMTHKVIREFHESYVGGHSGIDRTFNRISKKIWWIDMMKDIRKYVREWIICQKIKPINQRSSGLLMPLPIPPSVWEDLSVDFIKDLPKVENKTVIIVVVDRLSKSCHLGALPINYNASMVANFFVKEIIRLHGYPSYIISDRDKVFLSRFWKELNKLCGTKLSFTSAYHPQSDGQTEVVNRGIEIYLRSLVHEDPKKWLKLLHWAELWFNTNFNAYLGQTPFKTLFGREAPLIPQYEAENSPVEAVEGIMQDRAKALEAVKRNLDKAQKRMKQNADKQRKEVEFSVGDMVFVKLQPYRQLSAAIRLHNKLCQRFLAHSRSRKKLAVWHTN